MTPKIKSRLKNLGRRVGLEVRLSGANSRDDLRLIEFLAINSINTVLDVGANDGGFAELLLNAGFRGQIISFEPLPEPHATLEKKAAGVANWQIAPRLALSDKNGVSNFNITRRNTSSSLLEPTAEFVADTPNVEVSNVIEVETRRLDDLTHIHFDPKRALLKMDVQGAETLVLNGATQVLSEIRGVLTEMSLKPLYANQPDWINVHGQLCEHGLEIWDIWPGYRRRENKRLAQFDGLYFREHSN